MNEQEIDKVLFAARLRELIKESGLTTKEVGALVNLSNATISRYQSGELVPKIVTVHALAKQFNVYPDWLLGLGDTKQLDKKDYILTTLAAHLDDEHMTDKKLDMLTNYIQMMFDDF